MRLKDLSLIACAAVLCAGCANRASSVPPVSISASDYSTLSCEEARAKLQIARDRETALTNQQNNAALADTAGVFLLLVPLGSVFGADVAGELAQAKGEVLALERAVPQRCAVQ